VLAQKFPGMDITVQDLGQVQPAFDTALPSNLADRVRFMKHSFFDPQPIMADIYLLKMILHDWLQEECVRILRGLIPSLKPGAKVILIEYIGGEGKGENHDQANVPRSLKQYGTATDLRLVAILNAKERPVSAWKAIFKAADERFKVIDVKVPHGFFGVVEAVWEQVNKHASTALPV
jgi:hypothetical protein